MWQKFKGLIEEPLVVLPLIIITVAVISFGLGRQSVNLLPAAVSVGVSIGTSSDFVVSTATIGGETESVYASKNGTKYYYTDCSGLARISEQNKITFGSALEAEAAGYGKASNCH